VNKKFNFCKILGTPIGTGPGGLGRSPHPAHCRSWSKM